MKTNNLSDFVEEQKRKVLVLEGDGLFATLIQRKLEREGCYSSTVVTTQSQLKEALSEDSQYFACIMDYALEDAPCGEAIDIVNEYKIPVFVLAGGIDDTIRDQIWGKRIVDYALKHDARGLEYIVRMLGRMAKNTETKVLVVDDSAFFRKVVCNLLRIQQYQVSEANNGVEALEHLEDNPDTRVVITDYEMPRMDGFTLMRHIRKKYSSEEIAIIGVSSEEAALTAAGFLKNGANDFVVKQNFLTEEFYCRVTQCVESIERIREIRNVAVTDYLTGLHNRRYFFDIGNKIYSSTQRQEIDLACAMVDIDKFKNINDVYGHDVGDLAIRHVARVIQQRFRKSDVVTRFGGEEFCVLAINLGTSNAQRVFDSVRKRIAETPISLPDGQEISLTVSIGVTTDVSRNLEAMVGIADAHLYKAKESGRNKVIGDAAVAQ